MPVYWQPVAWDSASHVVHRIHPGCSNPRRKSFLVEVVPNSARVSSNVNFLLLTFHNRKDARCFRVRFGSAPRRPQTIVAGQSGSISSSAPTAIEITCNYQRTQNTVSAID